MVNLWPPFWGACIAVQEFGENYRYARVRLKRGLLNMNYVGTHFGGSIYAMTDPFYMFLLIHILGPGYIVWDKGAEIDFKRPGRTDLFADFKITEDIINNIKDKTAAGEKYIFSLPVSITDTAGEEIATVEKILYVRKK